MDAFVKRSKSTKVRNLKEPPSKRVKREVCDSNEDSDQDIESDYAALKSLPKLRRVDTAASEPGDDETPQLSESEDNPTRRTAIENSLPEIKPDKEALEEYQNFKASQEDEDNANVDAASRLESRKWVRGKTSLYVDAFNLALSTVLDEESHLFDEKELYIFDQWKKSSYEAQFL